MEHRTGVSAYQGWRLIASFNSYAFDMCYETLLEHNMRLNLRVSVQFVDYNGMKYNASGLRGTRLIDAAIKAGVPIQGKTWHRTLPSYISHNLLIHFNSSIFRCKALTL